MMTKQIVKTSANRDELRFGKHRFEHWQIDNQVYFITARCRERFPALAHEDAKAIFWDRFAHYTAKHGFVPWVTSLLDNHYHTIGYLREGRRLPKMMQRIHGSVAKLVNDQLRDQGVRAPWLSKPTPAEASSAGGKFWGDRRGREYFDGCLRSVKQGRLTYRYVLTQCRRHGVCEEYHDYAHTRVNIERECAIRRAVELDAFLVGVPYPRYMNNR
jgi:REP element-mobilizing transposase RayT